MSPKWFVFSEVGIVEDDLATEVLYSSMGYSTDELITERAVRR